MPKPGELMTVAGMTIKPGDRVKITGNVYIDRGKGWLPVYPKWNDALFALELACALGLTWALVFETWAHVGLISLFSGWIAYARAALQRDHLLADLSARLDREGE